MPAEMAEGYLRSFAGLGGICLPKGGSGKQRMRSGQEVAAAEGEGGGEGVWWDVMGKEQGPPSLTQDIRMAKGGKPMRGGEIPWEEWGTVEGSWGRLYVVNGEGRRRWVDQYTTWGEAAQGRRRR